MVRGGYKGRTAAVAAITVALFAVSLSIYVLFSAQDSLSRAAGEAHLSVMVLDDSGIDPVKTARQIEMIDKVRSVQYIDSTDAQREFSSYLGVNITAVMGEGAIPSSYIVTLDASQGGKRGIELIKQQLAAQTWVESVSYEEQVVTRLDELSDRIDQFALYFTTAIVVLIAILLYVICRLSVGVASNAMVGAPERYVRRMLVQRAVIDGVIAGVSSAVLLFGSVFFAQTLYPALELTFQTVPLIACSVLVAGFLANLTFTYISTLQISTK